MIDSQPKNLPKLVREHFSGVLSVKAANRLGNSFGHCDFDLVSDETIEGKRVTNGMDFQLLERPDFSLVQFAGYQQAAFNTLFPQVIERLLLLDDKERPVTKDFYLRGLGEIDFGNLLSVAAKLASPADRISGVVIRQVHGATEEMSARSLSHLLPPLSLLQSIHEVGKESVIPGNVKVKTPQLQVISATHISGGENGKDMKKALEQAELFAQVGRSMVEKVFPDISDRVVFMQDTDSLSAHEVQRYAVDVAEKSLDQETKDALTEKGARNGLNGKSLSYAAAHLLVQDMDHSELYQKMNSTEPNIEQAEYIVSMGGGQERLFYRLRHLLRGQLDTSDLPLLPTMQYFTRHSIPPYYMDKTGRDLSLNEMLKSGNIDLAEDRFSEAASYDLVYLEKFLRKRNVKVSELP